jgi:hypothetical protein
MWDGLTAGSQLIKNTVLIVPGQTFSDMSWHYPQRANWGWQRHAVDN